MAMKIDGAKRKDMFEIPVEKIVVYDTNYRTVKNVDDLKASIRAHGIQTPLRVYKNEDDEIELVAGFRRFEAVTELLEEGFQIERVPCIFQDRRQVQEPDLLVTQIIDNSCRVDASPLEKARAYFRLVDAMGLTVKEVSERTGKAEADVHRYLKVLEAPKSVQNGLHKGTISMTAALDIVRKCKTEDEREKAYERAKKSSGGDRATVKATRKATQTQAPRRRTRKVSEIEEKIQEADIFCKQEVLNLKGEDKQKRERAKEIVSAAQHALEWAAGGADEPWDVSHLVGK